MSSAHKVMQQKVAYVLRGVALDSRLRVNEKDPPNLQIVRGPDVVHSSVRSGADLHGRSGSTGSTICFGQFYRAS